LSLGRGTMSENLVRAIAYCNDETKGHFQRCPFKGKNLTMKLCFCDFCKFREKTNLGDIESAENVCIYLDQQLGFLQNINSCPCEMQRGIILSALKATSGIDYYRDWNEDEEDKLKQETVKMILAFANTHYEKEHDANYKHPYCSCISYICKM